VSHSTLRQNTMLRARFSLRPGPLAETLSRHTPLVDSGSFISTESTKTQALTNLVPFRFQAPIPWHGGRWGRETKVWQILGCWNRQA